MFRPTVENGLFLWSRNHDEFELTAPENTVPAAFEESYACSGDEVSDHARCNDLPGSGLLLQDRRDAYGLAAEFSTYVLELARMHRSADVEAKA
jgi:hypothetical protein